MTPGISTVAIGEGFQWAHAGIYGFCLVKVFISRNSKSGSSSCFVVAVMVLIYHTILDSEQDAPWLYYLLLGYFVSNHGKEYTLPINILCCLVGI